MLVFDSLFKFEKREPLAKLEDLMGCVAELPLNTNDFYSQMIKDLTGTMSNPALRIARKALMWIGTASHFRAFTMEELLDALAASSEELDDSGSASPRRALVDGRIEIQSWKDLNRILRRLCGSLIEVLPLKMATSTRMSDMNKDADSQAIFGRCVVQPMHQTVKDFLTLPEAGFFQFTEDSARAEALRGCQTFMRSALPDEIDSVISFPKHRPHGLDSFSASMAQHLEELRLFPLCLQMLNAFPESMGILQAQLDMKWYVLLPGWFHHIPNPDLVPMWQYIPIELTLTSSVLGAMFHFISRHGLRHAAQNFLSILDMGSTTESWPRYRHVIINAIATPCPTSIPSQCGSDGWTHGVSREKVRRWRLAAPITRPRIRELLADDQERTRLRMSIEDSIETIQLILNSGGIQRKDLGPEALLEPSTSLKQDVLSLIEQIQRILMTTEEAKHRESLSGAGSDLSLRGALPAARFLLTEILQYVSRAWVGRTRTV